jgi:hypothetical protein
MNTATLVKPSPVTLRFPEPEPSGVTYKTMLIEAQLELATLERVNERLNELLHIERNKRRRVKAAQRSLQAAYNEKLRQRDSYIVEADYWKAKYEDLTTKHGETV